MTRATTTARLDSLADELGWLAEQDNPVILDTADIAAIARLRWLIYQGALSD